MLACFSISWYCSIYKMLTIRAVVGKSAHFVVLVCIGYALGVGWKVALWQETGVLSPVAWLYLWNACVVGFDYSLVRRFSRGGTPAAA